VNDPIQFLLKRAAMVKEAGIVLTTSTNIESVLTDVSDDDLKQSILPTDTFSVRTIALGKKNEFSVRQGIETAVGAYIKQVTGAQVDLDDPRVRILVFLSEIDNWVCVSTASKLRLELRNREPGLKPFFHPSMMNASLARVMCNLAGVMPGEIVLDPFCGAGGILCEASLIGAKTVGIDLNWKLLFGGLKNLATIGNNHSLIQGDVRNIPLNEFDCIVTDPPYGRASSTRGARSIHLVESLLGNIDSLLRRRNESICICGDIQMNIQNIAEMFGLAVYQVLQIRVHSGLVREVLTLGF
jgi:tRNA (guanine10-N2)-dimethyltransferase